MSTEKNPVIGPFKDQYHWLSNMYPCPVFFEGQTYSCSEAAFQAAKCQDPKDRTPFLSLNGYQAKKLGRKVHLRPDWEQVKIPIMRGILAQKFSQQNHKLVFQLLETEDAELIEYNTWHDTFWGVDTNTNTGKNMLGKLLMETRAKLRNDKIALILGGSFNPPTKAHFALMQNAMNHFATPVALDKPAEQKVLGIFVPSSDAYVSRKMRKHHASEPVFSEQARKEMLEQSMYADMKVSSVEYGTTHASGHTLETLRKLSEEYPYRTLYFLMGSDKLSILPKWKTHHSLLTEFHIAVFLRNQDTASGIRSFLASNPELRPYADRFIILDTNDQKYKKISSTKARQAWLKDDYSAMGRHLEPETCTYLITYGHHLLSKGAPTCQKSN